MSPPVPQTPFELAESFNRLPRLENSPSGKVNNEWIFSVRKVDIEPPGLVLHMTNTPSRYTHVEKLPVDHTAFSSPSKLGLPIALCLMKSFVEGLGTSHSLPNERIRPYAPWKWGVGPQDSVLAKEVEKWLKSLKVREELSKVQVFGEDDKKVEDQVWEDFFKTLKSAITL
ncbi:hypothetical protein IE53DRAFT_71889 [Violaceomyces palustris]|uniref:Uncharacterized protein n=1 Tax=Violaceomyces palustris TaxID=1673888 RepID=A0ACD0NYS1_9BASI|nr:hypothetical protein IE53DRAFT_71889 [Violaceomyces palustris]